MKDDPRIFSFAPVARADARILILGSMPGKASLNAQQYYAHPRNLFWPIIAALYAAGPPAAYEERLQLLQDHNIALWDVLQSCVRETSLDADINGEVVNDFASFFAQHKLITHVFFNGGKAAHAFKRHVQKDHLQNHPVELTLAQLPSTSPAYAARSFEQKLQAWAALRRV